MFIANNLDREQNELINKLKYEKKNAKLLKKFKIVLICFDSTYYRNTFLEHTFRFLDVFCFYF